MCPLFPASSAKAPATREGKARKGRREPDLLSFRIRLFETNFLGPQGCLNKKHTCGEPTAGVAHTFPGGIQGPGRGVTAHQRAPPEKATGPARLAHPGFGLEHPGNGPKTGKSLNFTYLGKDDGAKELVLTSGYPHGSLSLEFPPFGCPECRNQNQFRSPGPAEGPVKACTRPCSPVLESCHEQR